MPSNPAPMVQPGQGACQPLLADVMGPERSWPAPGSADWRREWAVDGTTEAFSRERPPVLARILRLSRSVQALDTRGAKAGEEGATFDAPPAAPPPAATVAPILVIQADGQGGPMVQPPAQTLPMRLGPGPQRTTPQAAVVTGLDPRASSPRPAQAMGAALLPAADRQERAPGPAPVGPARRAVRGATQPAARGPQR
jgi:hypothetical protein